MNKVELKGYVIPIKKEAEAIEAKEFSTGKKCASFKLACRNEDGRIGFITVECWGMLSERVAGVKKGAEMQIVGSLITPKSYESGGKKVYPQNVVVASGVVVEEKETENI